ncbi:S-layer homology domain-containing protein [Pseudobacillus sp. 179-B 2D1 NHS]|uniref:S-layer homology domain-containing protein n=1 Tax=Pseudobacillus sp. 179-B 2D1 NHS TaxID=3374292 RepID=UPI00387A6603
MAYQPKSYRKFVATAATATMVASAVTPAFAANFPDVSDRYKEAVDYLVKNDITQGFPDGKFGVDMQIKRVDAAVMLAKALNLNTTAAPNAGFTDVPKRAQGAVNALKAAGIISGKTDTRFGADDELTRGEMAIIISRAYKLTDKAEVGFTDVSDRYTDAVSKLVAAGITQGKTPTQFGTADPIKRGEFAIFVFKAENPPVDPIVTGITGVKSINDTRYEVTFGKAIDADVAREIEKEPSRFIAYHGGQNANSSAAIVAETVTFNADKTVATIVLKATPQTDVNYRVALMDGDNNTTAKVVYESSPQVLVKGAEVPDVTVNADQDKLVINFKQKMDGNVAELFEAASYSLHDEKGNEIKTNLADLVVVNDNGADGEWVDKIKKDQVEFQLKPNTVLEAGKTYKIKVAAAAADKILTDDGDKLSEKNQVIEFKTPSADNARPTVKFATVTTAGANTAGKIDLVFDKDLDENLDTNSLAKLVKVKTPTGTEIKLAESGAIAVDGKKVTITTLGDEKNSLDKTISYTVSLPENVVANAYFYNALNKAGSVKAESQDDVAVKSMKAAFERDVKNDKEANLVLSFDQNVQDVLGAGAIEIKVNGKTYSLIDSADVEYGANGKQLKIKNVATAFDGLELENGQSYEIVAKAGKIATDSANAPTNREDLKATISSNIDVTAPKVDRMELVSANEIVLTFDKEVKDLKAKDVKIAKAYLIERDGNAVAIEDTISDSNYISVSTSGKKVTIKTNRSDLKFNTGEQQITIDANKFVGANGVENNAITATATTTAGQNGTSEDYLFVDNAAPEMVGAEVESKSSLTVTYSENILPIVTDNKEFASQFTFEGLELKNYGTVAGSTTSNEATFSFEDAEGTAVEVLQLDKNYPNLNIKYAPKTGVEVKDSKTNKAKSQTLTGAAKVTS